MNVDRNAGPAGNSQDFSAAFSAALQETAGESAPAESGEDDLEASVAEAQTDERPAASNESGPADAAESAPEAAEDEPVQEAALDYKLLFEREAQRLRSLEGRFRKERETWRRLEQDYRERLAATERPFGPADASSADSVDSENWREQPTAPRRPAPTELLARREAERAVRPVLDALERERHVASIASAHPDWRDLACDPELERFIDEQPGYVASAMRRVVECGDADEVIDLLAHFKERRGLREAARLQAERASRRARLAQNAEAVPSRPAGPPRSRPDRADFASAWTEAARDRAR